MGYFLAPLDRPRHVLDSGAHGDLSVRRHRRNLLGLPDSGDHVRQAAGGAREASVKMWGFRGPLGAFITAWGGIAMLVSAPFDDWWHNAYGLDVKILSPPHTVLAAGDRGDRIGRADPGSRLHESGRKARNAAAGAGCTCISDR